MSHKMPTPVAPSGATASRVCPVCGSVSYSRHGIHPQCAVTQADSARAARLKRIKKIGKTVAAKAANPSALNAWHKRCPRCKSQVHIRKLKCDCGHQF